jgi:uncharacterized protein (DUF983 family)
VPYDSLTRWQPDRTPELPQWPQPPTSIAMLRGACNRCPACGETRLFQGYLTVTPQCAHCGAPLGLARADDAPPYFTILIVAHLIVPPMYFVERAWEPPLWLHAAIWLPLALALSLGLLRPIKGATVGLMLKLGLLKTDIDDR